MRLPSECSHAAGQGWKAVGGSAVGKSHLADAIPCQDAHLITALPGGMMIAAIADGAGSAPLAEIGALSVVQTATDALTTALAGGSPRSEAEACEALRFAFQAAREALDHEAMARNVPVMQLATTLLVALVHPRGVVFAGVGDCLAVFCEGSGEWRLAMVPEKGEYANETTFLTSAAWEKQMQIRAFPNPPARVALFSDGLQRLALNLSVPEPHRPFFESIFNFVIQKPVLGEAAEALKQFLMSERVDARTDDDKTLVLLWPGGEKGGKELALDALRGTVEGYEAIRHRSGGTPQGTPGATCLLESLHGGYGASGTGRDQGPAREFARVRQTAVLRNLAEIFHPPSNRLGSGGEHDIYADGERQEIVKITHGGNYGFVVDQGPDITKRRLELRGGLPTEYLSRIGIQNAVFGDDARWTNVAEDRYSRVPAIVTRQSFRNDPRASQPDIDAFMDQKGFAMLPRKMLDNSGNLPAPVWYHNEREILAYDMTPGNVKEPVPGTLAVIDAIIHYYPRELLEDTARRNRVKLPWEK